MQETQDTQVLSLGPEGEGNGNPLQYSCLKNPIDLGTWKATVHGVAKSRHTSTFLRNSSRAEKIPFEVSE